MKLRLKEDPKEWRKNALLSALGLTLLTSLLRWRRVLPNTIWLTLLSLLAIIALAALANPHWFRGYYRVSHRIGFHLARAIGYVVLTCFFLLVITPMGILLRIFGQDPLFLKRRPSQGTCWTPSKPATPLDSIF